MEGIYIYIIGERVVYLQTGLISRIYMHRVCKGVDRNRRNLKMAQRDENHNVSSCRPLDE